MKEVAEDLRRIVDAAVPRLEELEDSSIARRPAPGKWAPKEILGHLIDSAGNNQQKFVRTMQQPRLEFPGYRQDDWVDLQRWAGADWANMVGLWKSYNHHLAFLIENVDPKHLKHEIVIEGVGPFTLEFVMSDYLEHLKHHLKQILPDLAPNDTFVNVYNA